MTKPLEKGNKPPFILLVAVPLYTWGVKGCIRSLSLCPKPVKDGLLTFLQIFMFLVPKLIGEHIYISTVSVSRENNL